MNPMPETKPKPTNKELLKAITGQFVPLDLHVTPFQYYLLTIMSVRTQKSLTKIAQELLENAIEDTDPAFLDAPSTRKEQPNV
jgi:hypothetical protein